MTTIFAIAGIDGAANSIGFAPPVSNGLEAWFHIGGTAAETTRNRAENGPDGSIAGTVTYGTGYATFSNQNNRLDTTILQTEACTLLCVARSGAAFSSNSTRPTLVGSYSSYLTAIQGAALQVTGTPSAAPAATLALTASRDSSGVPVMTPASITVADFSAWTFLAGVVKAGAVTGARAIYDKTNGTSATATPATGRLFDATNAIRFGNMTSLVYGTDDMAWGAYYSRDLSEAEIDKIYAFVKRRLADKYSISI